LKDHVSSIARSGVAHLDVVAAKAHPVVVEVITPANRPAPARDPDDNPTLSSFGEQFGQSGQMSARHLFVAHD
jgi:xanthine dehydrogenase YagR molybdenum-binding subunit